MTADTLQPTDEQTRAFVEGDPAAFQHLCELYGCQIVAYLRNRCRDPQSADDIAQEVWLKVWKARADFTNDSFRGWVFQIAKRTLVDHHRKLTRRKEVAGIMDSDFVHGAGEFTDEREAQLQALRDCLSEVGGDFVQVLRMKLVEEKSTDEIATTIGQTAGTVYSRIDRGKKQLKPCIEGKLS